MGNRRHRYERAFESYLRATRTPYVSVNEARRALLPKGADLSVGVKLPSGEVSTESLKSFDFVIYSEPANILVEIKGRQTGKRGDTNPISTGRLENWVTRDDVVGLQRWQQLFNGRDPGTEPGTESGTERVTTASHPAAPAFVSAFVFVYWCSVQPPDALFQEIFEFEGGWYALRMVAVDAYAAEMTVRSPRWGTVNLSREAFERISTPLSAGLRRMGRETAGTDDGAGEPGGSGPTAEGGRTACPRRVSAMPGLQRELSRQVLSRSRAGSLARMTPER